MTLPPDFLAVLRCLHTESRLSLLDDATLLRLNDQIVAGKLCNLAGNVLAQPWEAGLVNEDRSKVYAVIDGIPWMLVNEAVSLEQLR